MTEQLAVVTGVTRGTPSLAVISLFRQAPLPGQPQGNLVRPKSPTSRIVRQFRRHGISNPFAKSDETDTKVPN